MQIYVDAQFAGPSALMNRATLMALRIAAVRQGALRVIRITKRPRFPARTETLSWRRSRDVISAA
jgi:hypothetical protein